MFEGKRKAVTFSYDDGVEQDIRLIDLFDKYGVKCTFNLNSGMFGVKGDDVRKGVYIRADRLKKEDIRNVYKNHEIAAHTLTHPDLTGMSDREIIRQVEEDRIRLSELAGKEVRGLAYPGGGINYNNRVAQLIRKYTGIQYARTTVNTDSFNRQRNLYTIRPNVYHVMNMKRLFQMGEKFLSLDSEEDQILYIWGHSFEFDIGNTWGQFEDFLKMISGHKDIFYGTNSQVLLNCLGK